FIGPNRAEDPALIGVDRLPFCLERVPKLLVGDMGPELVKRGIGPRSLGNLLDGCGFSNLPEVLPNDPHWLMHFKGVGYPRTCIHQPSKVRRGGESDSHLLNRLTQPPEMPREEAAEVIVLDSLGV